MVTVSGDWGGSIPTKRHGNWWQYAKNDRTARTRSQQVATTASGLMAVSYSWRRVACEYFIRVIRDGQFTAGRPPKRIPLTSICFGNDVSLSNNHRMPMLLHHSIAKRPHRAKRRLKLWGIKKQVNYNYNRTLYSPAYSIGQWYWKKNKYTVKYN